MVSLDRLTGLNVLLKSGVVFRCRNGHVNRNQFRQVLRLNCILLTDEHIYSLEQRYLDELGFNYFQFIKEADPSPELTPLVRLAKYVNLHGICFSVFKFHLTLEVLKLKHQLTSLQLQRSQWS